MSNLRTTGIVAALGAFALIATGCAQPTSENDTVSGSNAANSTSTSAAASSSASAGLEGGASQDYTTGEFTKGAGTFTAHGMEFVKGEQQEPTKIAPDGSFLMNDNVKPGSLRVDLLFDFSCGACQKLEQLAGDKFAEQIKSGEVEFHLNPVSFLDKDNAGDYSSRAGSAFVAAYENDGAETAYKLYRSLYGDENFNPRGVADGSSREVTSDELADIAKKVGASNKTVEQIKDNTYFDFLKENTINLTDNKDFFPDGGIHSPSLVIERGSGQSAVVTLSGSAAEDYEYALESYAKAKSN